ncbi:neuronal acetylcholine receptor subunit beta-3-like [Actinia tenebrosa]|uniref:Neuronal acetylcholine receptor subunit beta-3-like n=1 Tax=Actinia tenebrosa TaxID=6105 RepID=A0A6P8HVI4_ACTTE|nr:neuronal acetylcholine receptor subunit beta-3-like [Actinia tenebrosa]
MRTPSRSHHHLNSLARFPLGAILRSRFFTSIMNCLQWFLLMSILTAKTDGAVQTNESVLYQKLFQNYNKFTHPVKHYNNTVKVMFDFQLINILDVSARDQYIKTYAWVNQYWRNELLTWDPAQYGGIKIIYVDPKDIWVPDVLLYSNIDEEDRFGGGKYTYKANVALSHDGGCVWLNPAIFKSICMVDVTFFPFDDQTCELKFGSWSFDISKIDLHPKDRHALNKNYIKNGEWELNSITFIRNQKHYKCCVYDFVDVTIKIEISRVSLDYIMKLIIPCSLISSMIFLGFVLPPESGERIGLSITVLLAMTVFQQLTSELMPSYGFPLLGQYYFATMIEIGASLTVTTFILNFYHRSTRRMPAFLRKLILVWMASLAFPFRKNKPYKSSIPLSANQGDSGELSDSNFIVESMIDNNDPTHSRQNRWNSLREFPEGYQISPASTASIDNMFTGNTSPSRRNNYVANRRGLDKMRFRRHKLKQNGSKKKLYNNQDNASGNKSYFMSAVGFGDLSNDDSKSELSLERERNQKEWKKAARVLDRMFLIISVVIGTVTLFGIFLKAPRFHLL